jgi:hypothetical protein
MAIFSPEVLPIRRGINFAPGWSKNSHWWILNLFGFSPILPAFLSPSFPGPLALWQRLLHPLEPFLKNFLREQMILTSHLNSKDQ